MSLTLAVWIRYDCRVKRDFPIEIDRSSPLNFSEQLVEGIKAAIREGRYREGDRLPTWREMADRLGVSQRVPREAMSRLVREGWVVARPRLGCVVASGIALRKAWKGTVLVVQSKSESESFSSVRMCNALDRVLTRAGFAVVRTTVEHKGGKHTPYDLTMTERLLTFKIDFVVIESSSRQLQRWVSAHHVPYLFSDGEGGYAAWNESALGNRLRLDFSRAIAEFVKHCQRARVKQVLQVSFVYPGLFDATPVLEAAGIACERWLVPCERDVAPSLVTVAGMRAVLERLQKGRDWLPDVLLVTDDYLATGVIMALLHAGVRIPDELRVVVFANVGNEPVFPISLARIAADCAGFGESIARVILEATAGRELRPVACNVRYVPGETFPAC